MTSTKTSATAKNGRRMRQKMLRFLPLGLRSWRLARRAAFRLLVALGPAAPVDRGDMWGVYCSVWARPPDAGPASVRRPT